MRTLITSLLLVTLTACGSLPPETPDPDADPDPGIRAWPLLSVVEKPGKRDVDVLWPLLHVGERTDRTDVDVLWPLIHVGTGEQRSAFDLRPIVWHESTATRSDTVVFPFFWRGRHKEKEDDWYTALFPFYFRGQSGQDIDWIHVWPLYGVFRNKQSRFQSVAFPLFAHYRDPEVFEEAWHFLFPLFAWSTEGEETHVRALPLVWHTFGPEARTTVIFPLWWDLEETDERFVMLFPLFGMQRRPDFRRTFVGGPLWISTVDGERRSTDVLWPIFHHETAPDRQETWLFPFLWIERNPSERKTHLWPLYGVSENQVYTERTVAWPLFSHYAYAKGGYRLHAPAPLFMVERRPHRKETTIFPLFGVSWRRYEEGERTKWWVVGPLSYGHRDHDSSDFRILWKLVQNTDRADGSSVFAINPFWHSETTADGTATWSVFLGLYGQATRGEKKTHRLLWFIRW